MGRGTRKNPTVKAAQREKYVTLAVSRQAAEALITKGRIVGKWNKWWIREFVQVGRYYKCRLMGHKGANYKEREGSEPCHNCGAEGHKRFECTGKVKYYLCEGEHKADGRDCAVYRRLLREERAARAEK